MHWKRGEWIEQLPSFSDLEPYDVDVNISVITSVVALITIVLGITQNIVLTNQIILEFRTFT